MKATHTPGPWKVWDNIDGKKGELGVLADTAPCVIAHDMGEKHWPEIARANAALIAAAPEMFEALRELVKWMDDSGLSATSPGGVGPLHYGSTEYSVVTAARAAIAKAEGR